ncbi:hypothetical protein V7138_24155 [Bacillus sp. JJ1533]|uniref:hypothetical protein n=1 Tax=Bacillus sp. JJ1533 TaxID=3122959 RepID=UPI002FFEB8B7
MRRILMVVVFVCALILTGCQSQQTAPAQQVNDDEKSPPQQAEVDGNKNEPSQQVEEVDKEKEEPPKQPEEESNVEPFEINSAMYENRELTIHYPQLVNMQNKDLEQRINTFIKDDAVLFLNQYQDGGSPLKMDYEVILPESDTFTIQYTGNYNGGMYPTHLLFKTNIDWKKGEKIKLSDLFVIDEQFIETLKNGKYMDWENPPEPNKEKQAAVIEYLNTFTNQNLIEAFQKADHPNPEENQYGIFSHYLNNTVVISIQVPHALGDHAEFELNIADLVKK